MTLTDLPGTPSCESTLVSVCFIHFLHETLESFSLNHIKLERLGIDHNVFEEGWSLFRTLESVITDKHLALFPISAKAQAPAGLS